jgi:hypothetical protein
MRRDLDADSSPTNAGWWRGGQEKTRLTNNAAAETSLWLAINRIRAGGVYVDHE